MPPNPYCLAVEGNNYMDVLRVDGSMTELEKEVASAALPRDQYSRFIDFTVTTSNKIGCHGTLVVGALLCMNRRLDHVDSNRTLDHETKNTHFEKAMDAIGIKRTQAFRCMAASVRFGTKFIEEPAIFKRFSPESLKRLAPLSVPDSACEEAFASARQGVKIDIKYAEELKRKHRVEDVTDQPSAEIVQTPKRNNLTGSRNWTFKGDVVRINVITNASTEIADLKAAVIADLKRAIEELSSTERDGQSRETVGAREH